MSDDGPNGIFFNILRVILFGFMCGVVFTILLFLSSYSIPDTNLRAAIIEERIMNSIENEQVQSLSQINSEFLASAITKSEDLRKDDSFAVRLRFIDLLSKKAVVLDIENEKKTVDYDANVFNQDITTSKFRNFYPLTGKVKSNYESTISKRFWTEPATGIVYAVQFEFVTVKS